MIPIQFEGANVTFAKDQPEYLPLPALRLDDGQGTVVTCWKMSFRERVRILFGGPLWIRMLTFGHALMPIRPDLDRPFDIVRTSGGYQPTVDDLDASNPPQGGSGVPSRTT